MEWLPLFLPDYYFNKVFVIAYAIGALGCLFPLFLTINSGTSDMDGAGRM